MDDNIGSSSSDQNTDNREQDDSSKEKPNVVVELRARDSIESVRVNITNIPLVSYAPKASKSPDFSGMKIR